MGDRPASAAVVEAPAEGDRAVLRSLRSGFFAAEPPRYWLTRFVFLRALGLVYSVAFLVLWRQMIPLFGSHGLMPANRFLERMREDLSFWDLPTLFYWGGSDRLLLLAAGLGLALSVCVLLGVENAIVMGVLWVLYLSFVHIGQDF